MVCFSTPEQKICRIRREYRKFLLNLQSSWEWVFVRNSLIITYKVTKNIPFPQLFLNTFLTSNSRLFIIIQVQPFMAAFLCCNSIIAVLAPRSVIRRLFGFHLFLRFYRTNLAPEFSTFLYIPLPS